MFRSIGFKPWVLVILLLGACSAPNAATPVAVGVPNPAAVFCIENGGESEIVTAADGSQGGNCVFPDGSVCDEWAYQRGECQPGDSLVPAAPAIATPVLPPSQPVFVTEPLQIQASSVPVPFAVLVNTGDGRGITAYDRSGLALGEWETAPFTGLVHPTGAIGAGISATPLVFWNWSVEQPGMRLSLNAGGKITSLFDLADPGEFTGMVGLPASPLVAYSTMRYGEASGNIHSWVYLAQYQNLASAAPVLYIENNDYKYLTPLAIRAENGQPLGLWFTYHMYGIGGTPALFTNNYGLYYYDLAAKTVYEFLSPEKTLNDLSGNQAYAVWTSSETSGDMQMTDLIHNQTVSFPKKPESELSAGLARLSPGGNYLAWLEGINLDFDKIPSLTVRIGTYEGYLIDEYPHANFAKASGLGMETNLTSLGWLSDETVLVGVSQLGKEAEAAIVAVNANTGEITLYARGRFAGVAYP